MSDDECSVIGDKGEISYVDFQQDKSVWNYKPQEEGPIIVSVPFPFIDGKPKSVLVGKNVADSITLTNTTNEAVDLWTKIFASTPENSFTLSLMKPPSPDDEKGKSAFLEGFELEDRILQPGEMLTVWLSCKPMAIGVHTSVVHFDVGCDTIERVVILLSEDKISQSLASKVPYSRTTRKKQFNADSYVAGSRPRRATKQGFRNRLPRYDIPKNIRELIESKQIPNAITRGLTWRNYADYFKTLLIMEEIQLEESMRNYDLECVNMWKKGRFLSLLVPGLAERRPSLVHGDYIFAKLANADDATRPFQGYIHRVEADEVCLQFSKDFHSFHSNANLYNICFTCNRVEMRRRYQAIDAAEQLERELLFPTEFSENRLIETTHLVPISCNLNEEQIYSIEMVLGCNGGPPYVIHGPPGTGKTMTIVEAILQIYKYRNNTRILACAPSNSAADHMLEMLTSEKAVQVRENDILRLNASSRQFEDVKPEHIGFCSFEDLIFKCPPLNTLKRYRIIVSTYMSASLLYAEGLGRGHFSHIFLDEAGQASEPESMVPLSNLCQKNTVVVLAGDPMQMGPVIFSRDAEAYGLGKSYLERLFECEPYCSGDENYVTKLIRNYRSHPEILYLPSTLFYQGELIPCKESINDTTSLMSSVNLNEGNDFPVVFFGIQGCDEREGSNPSWFNRIEVSKVVEIVQKLVTKGSLTELDIGVITPYRQQVLKIKQVLEDLDMADIKVGSVEQFQGQERKVIIVSTVRSTVKHNEFDRAHCLGFLTNPRRFNVALTRAILLLIIVSNPHIISKDVHWNKLLWYCVDHDSYQGCALPERHEFFGEHQGVEDFANDFEEKLRLSEGVACGQEPFQTEIPKPVKDEEWSDGWH